MLISTDCALIKAKIKVPAGHSHPTIFMGTKLKVCYKKSYMYLEIVKY